MQLKRILSDVSQAGFKSSDLLYSAQDSEAETERRKKKPSRWQASRCAPICTGQREATTASRSTLHSHAFILFTNIQHLFKRYLKSLSLRASELTAQLFGDVTSSNISPLLPLLLLLLLSPRLRDGFVCAPTFELLRPTAEKGQKSEVHKRIAASAINCL